jgi:hypothetical protein
MHILRLALPTLLLALACSSDPAPVDAARPIDARLSDDAPLGPDAPSIDAPIGDAPAADAPSTDAPAPSDATASDATPSDATATSDATAGGYQYALVRESCGPADGPAIELTIYGAPGPVCIVGPDQPSLSFYIHDLGGATIPPAAGDTITSTGSEHGTVTACPAGDGPCRTTGDTDDWSVTFDTYDETGDASGSYTIDWGSESETGSFDATRCARSFPCG